MVSPGILLHLLFYYFNILVNLENILIVFIIFFYFFWTIVFYYIYSSRLIKKYMFKMPKTVSSNEKKKKDVKNSSIDKLQLDWFILERNKQLQGYDIIKLFQLDFILVPQSIFNFYFFVRF